MAKIFLLANCGSSETKNLFEVLDDVAKINDDEQVFGTGESLNIVIEGSTGVGKTQMVEQWCRMAGLQLLYFDMAQVRDSAALYKADWSMLNDVSAPGILFLDDFNLGNATVQDAALSIMKNRELGQNKLNGLLFTVLAQNPAEGGYNGDYSIAILGNAMVYTLLPDKKRTLIYFQQYCDNQMCLLAENADGIADKIRGDGSNPTAFAEEMLALYSKALIGTALLESDEFKFDNAAMIAVKTNIGVPSLSPRSFINWMNISHGDPQKALNFYNMICGNTNAAFEYAETNDPDMRKEMVGTKIEDIRDMLVEASKSMNEEIQKILRKTSTEST